MKGWVGSKSCAVQGGDQVIDYYEFRTISFQQ
jgi:hypothetical protein